MLEAKLIISPQFVRILLLSFRPYSPKSRFNKDDPSINFTRYTSRQRSRLNHLITLYSFIWFYWFLSFVGRVGPIQWFVSCNFHGYSVAQQSSGIRIPVTKYHESLPSTRHLLDISINREGKIKINGENVYVDEISKLITYYRKFDPPLRIFLIIDHKCEMDIINKILSEIRNASIHKVYFCTNEYPYKF